MRRHDCPLAGQILSETVDIARSERQHHITFAHFSGQNFRRLSPITPVLDMTVATSRAASTTNMALTSGDRLPREKDRCR